MFNSAASNGSSRPKWFRAAAMEMSALIRSVRHRQLPRDRDRHSERHADGADGHRLDSPRDRRAEQQGARNPGREHAQPHDRHKRDSACKPTG